MIPALCLCNAKQTAGVDEGSTGRWGYGVFFASGHAQPVCWGAGPLCSGLGAAGCRALGTRAGRVCTPGRGGVSGLPSLTRRLFPAQRGKKAFLQPGAEDTPLPNIVLSNYSLAKLSPAASGAFGTEGTQETPPNHPTLRGCAGVSLPQRGVCGVLLGRLLPLHAGVLGLSPSVPESFQSENRRSPRSSCYTRQQAWGSGGTCSVTSLPGSPRRAPRTAPQQCSDPPLAASRPGPGPGPTAYVRPEARGDLGIQPCCEQWGELAAGELSSNPAGLTTSQGPLPFLCSPA